MGKYNNFKFIGATIEIITNIDKMQGWSDNLRLQKKKIAIVPTMGFLHKGHLSLMQEAHKHADVVVVSIFVNPTQFGPNEDLESYPRNLPGDIEMSEKEKVDIIFTPDAASLYGKNYQTYLNLEKLPNHLCGISRPTHFRGVATVVAKLFNIVKPHVAIFGQKDYQQFLVIKQMTFDLNFDINIIGAPTIRESDGLAMSSRNAYLSQNQRSYAVCLYKSLNNTKKLIQEGVKDAKKLIDAASDIIKSYPETNIDYIKLCDAETLDDIYFINRPALMALAVKVGKTRLIDNAILYP